MKIVNKFKIVLFLIEVQSHIISYHLNCVAEKGLNDIAEKLSRMGIKHENDSSVMWLKVGFSRSIICVPVQDL